jgi:hypothetical protein
MTSSNPLVIVREVLERGLLAVERFVDRHADQLAKTGYFVGDPPAGSPVINAAHDSAVKMRASWTVIASSLDNARGRIATAWNVPGMTPEARRAGAAKVIAETQAAIAPEQQSIEQAVTGLRELCIRVGRPSRPPGNKVEQEASLTNIRADLKMLLDGTPTELLADTALAELSAEAADPGDTEDALTTWFLASTDWFSLYARSRRADHEAQRFESYVAERLAPFEGDEQKMARQLLQVVEGAQGLAGAIVAVNRLVTMALDELAQTQGRADMTLVR